MGIKKREQEQGCQQVATMELKDDAAAASSRRSRSGRSGRSSRSGRRGRRLIPRRIMGRTRSRLCMSLLKWSIFLVCTLACLGLVAESWRKLLRRQTGSKAELTTADAVGMPGVAVCR